MKKIKRLNFILFLTITLLILGFISCTSNSQSGQNLNTETVNRVFPVFATETIVAMSVKPLEDNSDLIYLLYESTPVNTSSRSATDTLLMEGLYTLNTLTGSTQKATDLLSEALSSADQLLCLDDSFIYINSNKLVLISETAQLNWENTYPTASLLSINMVNDTTHGKCLSVFIKDNDEFICVLLAPSTGETLSQTVFSNFMEGNAYYGPFKGFDSSLILSKAEEYQIFNAGGLFLTPSFEENEKIFFIAVNESKKKEIVLNILSVFDGKLFKTTYESNGTFVSRTELPENNQVTSRNTWDEMGIGNPVFDVPSPGIGNSSYYFSETGIPQISDINTPPGYMPEITFVESSPITVGKCNNGNCLVEILVNAGKYEVFNVYLNGKNLHESDVAIVRQGNGITKIILLVPAGSHKIKLFGEHNNCYSNSLITTIICDCGSKKPTITWNPQNPPAETTHEATAGLSVWSDQLLDTLTLTNNGIPETVATPLTAATVTDDGKTYFEYGMDTTLAYGANSFEVSGSNSNGSSEPISHNTESDFEALSVSGPDAISVHTCVDGRCTVLITIDSIYPGSLTDFIVTVDNDPIPPDSLKFSEVIHGEYALSFTVPAGTHEIMIVGEHYGKLTNYLKLTIECLCSSEKPTLKWNPENTPPENTSEATAGLSVWSDQLLDTLTLTNNGIPETVATPLTAATVTDDGKTYFEYGMDTTLAYGANSFEVSGSNANGSSEPISHDTNSDFEALSFATSSPVTVFDCEDGKCRVSVFIHSNHPGDFTNFLVVVNGFPVPLSDISAIKLTNGTYDIGFEIPPGSSEIEIFGNDRGHFTNSLKTTIECNCPTQPPTLQWNPENTPPETTSEPTITLSIRSDQNLERITIVDNAEAKLIEAPVAILIADDQFLYEETVELSDGENTLSVQGENGNGTSNSINCNVTFTPPAEPPVIEFAETPPATVNNCEGEECTITVKIRSSTQLTALMIKSTNNETPTTIPIPQPDNDGNYPITFTLNRGRNYIAIMAVNDHGTSNNLMHWIDCVCPN